MPGKCTVRFISERETNYGMDVCCLLFCLYLYKHLLYYLITHFVRPFMFTVTINNNVTAWSIWHILSFSVTQLVYEEIIRAKLLRVLCM